MADVHTRLQRARNMAAIKASGNKSTEGELIKLFRKAKITGWRRNNKKVLGKPDFLFRKQKILVFADGCFWHGCSRCSLISDSHKAFWREKISKNKSRDQRVNKSLKRKGWKVIRIQEHEIKMGNLSLTNKLTNIIKQSVRPKFH